MADSSIPVTPGSGTNVDGYSLDNTNFRQAIVIGDPTTAAKVAPVDSVWGLTVKVVDTLGDPVSIHPTYGLNTDRAADDLVVTAVGAAAAAVTLTLPAPSVGQFHRISYIEISQYVTAALTASATPITVTTTNLPGSLAFTFPTAGAIGTVFIKSLQSASPLKSSVAATATTIVCPATTSVIWRVTVFYKQY